MLDIDHVKACDKIFMFSAYEGQRWHLQGPTGFGKTTFFNIVTGLYPLSTGDIRWKGVSFSQQSVERRPFSYLQQDYPLFPHLTVEKQVALMPCALQAKQWVQLYLPHCFNLQGHELSGGEKRLIGLIRMICENRPVMLLDESFVGMDATLKIKIMHHLKDHQQQTGCLILYTSHEKDDFATHIYTPSY